MFTVRYEFNLHKKFGFVVKLVVDEVGRRDTFPILSFPLISIIPPMIHSLHLYLALTRRTNGRNLGTFDKGTLFRKPESTEQKTTVT